MQCISTYCNITLCTLPSPCNFLSTSEAVLTASCSVSRWCRVPFGFKAPEPQTPTPKPYSNPVHRHDIGHGFAVRPHSKDRGAEAIPHKFDPALLYGGWDAGCSTRVLTIKPHLGGPYDSELSISDPKVAVFSETLNMVWENQFFLDMFTHPKAAISPRGPEFQSALAARHLFGGHRLVGHSAEGRRLGVRGPVLFRIRALRYGLGFGL